MTIWMSTFERWKEIAWIRRVATGEGENGTQNADVGSEGVGFGVFLTTMSMSKHTATASGQRDTNSWAAVHRERGRGRALTETDVSGAFQGTDR